MMCFSENIRPCAGNTLSGRNTRSGMLMQKNSSYSSGMERTMQMGFMSRAPVEFARLPLTNAICAPTYTMMHQVLGATMGVTR